MSSPSTRAPPRRAASSSTRAGRPVAMAQREHRQHFPRPGWVEHDAAEIWSNVEQVVPERAGRGGHRRRSGGRGRHHQPARDDGGLGPAHRRAGGARHRLAGHPHRPAAGRAGRGEQRAVVRRAHRAAAGDLLRRTEAALAAGQRRRPAGAGRTRRGALRHHGQLADLEAHRRARHRRHQRQPDAADEPAHPRLGPGAARRPGRPRGHAAGDPFQSPRCTAPRAASSPGCRWPAPSATSRPRSSARPASSPARASAPTAPAASCC